VSEELGIRGSVVFASKHTKLIEVGPIPAISYPGLYSRYSMTVFKWYMPKAFFRREGYVEEQADKKTFFAWHVLHLSEC
jgi:hypothetical protein